MNLTIFVIFFFQAEDGIRDGHVTGVQTCALPICTSSAPSTTPSANSDTPFAYLPVPSSRSSSPSARSEEIGRASCRERVAVPVRAVVGYKKIQVGQRVNADERQMAPALPDSYGAV